LFYPTIFLIFAVNDKGNHPQVAKTSVATSQVSASVAELLNNYHLSFINYHLIIGATCKKYNKVNPNHKNKRL